MYDHLVFQIHFFEKQLNNQRAAVMLQLTLSFYTNFSKNRLFISANTCEKYMVNKEYCIAHHEDNMCYLPNDRYHIILTRDEKELLQELDAFCFNYHHVDCLYTPFKYRFSGHIVIKIGQSFDNLQRAVHFNHQNRGVDRRTSKLKKRNLSKEYTNIY